MKKNQKKFPRTRFVAKFFLQMLVNERSPDILLKSIEKAYSLMKEAKRYIDYLKDSKRLDIELEKKYDAELWLKQNNIKTYFLDIGGAGGFQGNWKWAQKKGLVNGILSDFDYESENTFSNVFGDENKIVDFFITDHAGCSSCLEPLSMAELEKYEIAFYFKLRKVIKVHQIRVDELLKSGNIPVPQFVKMDVQGYEYRCLQGFGDYLDQVLAVELEVQFAPIYKGQALFPEIHEFLLSKGFTLRKLERQGHWWGGEYIEANVFYAKNSESEVDRMRLELWNQINSIKRVPPPSSEAEVVEKWRNGSFETWVPKDINAE